MACRLCSTNLSAMTNKVTATKITTVTNGQKSKFTCAALVMMMRMMLCGGRKKKHKRAEIHRKAARRKRSVSVRRLFASQTSRQLLEMKVKERSFKKNFPVLNFLHFLSLYGNFTMKKIRQNGDKPTNSTFLRSFTLYNRATSRSLDERVSRV